MLSTLSTIFCFYQKQKKEENIIESFRRHPNKDETSLGIPGWWIVEIGVNEIIYISDTGRRFKNIREVCHWRTNGPFEDVDWDIPSF